MCFRTSSIEILEQPPVAFAAHDGLEPFERGADQTVGRAVRTEIVVFNVEAGAVDQVLAQVVAKNDAGSTPVSRRSARRVVPRRTVRASEEA